MTVQEKDFRYLGKGRKIIDGLEKVIGSARYPSDLTLPGMLHIRPVLSPYAHAQIVSIDSSAALEIPGVVAVLTADDLCTRDVVINSRHSAVLAIEKVLFRGQPVVAVVAESEAAAIDGAQAVQIEYEPLPTVADMYQAIEPDTTVIWPNGLPKDGADLTAAHAAVDKQVEERDEAPTNVHAENHFERGDVEAGFAQADIVIERTYKTPIVHQGYLEPHAVVAEPGPLAQSVTLYTSTQGQFQVRNETARILGLPRNKVRVVPMAIGGGFGAKYGLMEPLAGAVALAIGKPVSLVLSRSEDFLTTTPSPAVEIQLKVGASKDGQVTAIQGKAMIDNGIFPFTIGGIIGILLGGYYRCENVKIDCYEIITHKPQAGAYRAPGAPSATFAIESTIDDIARELGQDPLEFRLKNAVYSGDISGNGDPWPNIGLRECLEALKDHPTWKHVTKGPNEGIGIAVGGWPCAMSPAAAVCRLDTDGTVRVHVGSVDISGVNSTYVLVAAEMLGVSPDMVEIVQGDTTTGPFAPGSGGSQTTYSVSGAVSAAAREVRRQILEVAAEHFEAAPDDIEITDGIVQVRGAPAHTIPIGKLAQRAQSKAGGDGPVIGEGRAAVEENAPGFVVHMAKVAVDPETGHVELKQYLAIQDVGFAMNPMLVEGQMHGGTVQGIGWALHERMIYDENGQLITGSFMDYDLPKITSVPSIETVMVEKSSTYGPFGARGIGEPPITAGAAAIANAVRDAVGVRIAEVPIRPELVWKALNE